MGAVLAAKRRQGLKMCQLNKTPCIQDQKKENANVGKQIGRKRRSVDEVFNGWNQVKQSAEKFNRLL